MSAIIIPQDDFINQNVKAYDKIKIISTFKAEKIKFQF